MVINSIIGAWIHSIGGVETLYFIFSSAFLFTFLYIFYKIG